jgi:hypothetical protein
LASTTALLLALICNIGQTADLPLAEGFERDADALKAEGWRLPATCSLVSEDPRDGVQCLEVDVPDAKQRYAELFIPVEQGRFYGAAVWVRCRDVVKHPDGAQNRGAVIFLQWADHDRKWVGGGSFPTGLHGTHDWSLRRVAFTRQIPENVGYVQVLLGVEGAGTAWFDGLKVYEVTAWDGINLAEPGDGDTVDVRRPLFKWEMGEEKVAGVEIQVSRSPDFAPADTITFPAETAECRPADALLPGTWYWRVQVAAGGGKLPSAEVNSFVVAENASLWPPDITPLWEWSDDTRPTLRASVAPHGAGQKLAALTDGEPAEIISYEDTILRFRPPRDLARGIHEVQVEASSDKGTVEVAGVFCSKQPGSRVAIRDDKILLVDGEPFFPIGAYRDPSDTLTDFSGLEEAGFNVTHSYRFEDGTEDPVELAREYLRAAHEHGLKVFMGFHRGRIADRDYPWLQRWAAELMDEPALLTWYLMDEPAGHGIPVSVFQQMNSLIGAVDPFHPQSMVLCRTAEMKTYAPACDILWNDPYPLPSRPLTMVEDWAKLGVEATRPGQPYWVVLQAHDLRYWRDYEAALEEFGPVSRPTAQETRCMAHMALAAGANGIIWYWGPNSAYHMQKDAPEVWRGLCDTVQELRSLTPFLVARRTPADEVTVADPLRAWSRTAGGDRVLALVNTGDEAAEAKVDLTSFGVAEIRQRPDGNMVTLTNGKLTASFEPYEVKLYEWKGKG